MTNNLQNIATEAQELPMVYSANVWKDRRVYINLVGADRGYNGDRTYSLYYDASAGWVSERGKGRTSSSFDESLEAFETAMNIN